ncbi:hypothetical protein XELAEV_18018398mg [Xenopus laevis]|uniref:Uncharacterized protein n=1 Tax=Xenopus laevis TaxID=8355 RepID=A0A974DE70_XENLA|nr:hypothetical protein XELAEV_18018398mg [Xenopus laevis]
MSKAVRHCNVKAFVRNIGYFSHTRTYMAFIFLFTFYIPPPHADAIMYVRGSLNVTMATLYSKGLNFECDIKHGNQKGKPVLCRRENKSEASSHNDIFAIMQIYSTLPLRCRRYDKQHLTSSVSPMKLLK